VQAIVTGASRGLGLALTRALADRGWRVVVDARDGDALEREVGGIEGVVAIAGDVTDADHRLRLVEAAGAPIHLLVNNASILGPSPQPVLADYPLEELRRVYEINVLAPLALVQLALPRLADGAAVLNVTLRRRRRGVRDVGWLRLGEGGSRAAHRGPRCRAAGLSLLRRRSR
jgi:NAD(P)-dependent dehydrogenase (short-subunit alcohol dehydrogenase family)